MFRYSCNFTFMCCQRKLVSCPMLETEGTVATFRVSVWRSSVRLRPIPCKMVISSERIVLCLALCLELHLTLSVVIISRTELLCLLCSTSYDLLHTHQTIEKQNDNDDRWNGTYVRETIGCMIALPTYDHALSLLLRVDVSALNNRVQCTSCMHNQY